jgi:ERCC4-type nuclease
MARIVVDTREPDGMLRTFWPQLGRMRRATRFAYLMLEGGSLDNGPIAPAAIRGVCVAAMDLGVQIVRSEDLRDSAQWLHRLAERRASGAYRSPPAYAQRPRRAVGVDAAEPALAAVPGTSEVTAKALLLHFGSLAGVVREDPSEWEQVRGIGRQRSRAMTQTFDGAPTASGSRRSHEPQDPAT